MIIKHILEKKGNNFLHTIHKNQTLMEASKKLYENKIGALPVCEEDKKIQGIISERDIIKNIALFGNKSLNLKVNDTMTLIVCSCKSTDTVKNVIYQMKKGKFRHMPVIEENIIIGFVSISDLILEHSIEIEFENDTLKGSFRSFN
tara:strand:+ start:171 stop:608 length:438 start_codon:yes stop_codon:yes gene_type:complete